MRLTELHVAGYRSLVDATLPLRDLMVMIGPNGSGKTALLEVFVLLQQGAQKQLASRFEELGGAQAVLNRGENSSPHLELSLFAEIEQGNPDQSKLMSYIFELVPRGAGYVFPSELLEWGKKTPSGESRTLIDANLNEVSLYAIAAMDSSGKSTNFSVGQNRKSFNSLELILAQVQPDKYGAEFRDFLAEIQFYSSLDIIRAMRMSQTLTPAHYPGRNGESLYSSLYNLRAEDSEAYSRIEEMLGLGFSGFRKLEFPVVGAGQVTLAWYQKGISGPLYPNQLSEGMLRFLWLVTILLSPDIPSMILLDEPEVSMHPELLKLLAGMLQDASVRTQVLVATHSPDLIRWLEPAQILVTEKDEDGSTHLTYADSLNLDEWLKEYTLRDLWLMGTLGGRP